ncbi:TerB family tellurite resistance protein [Jannaschia aquimarina]|uniref:Tellurite resistance protein TerB n=1 Tax=Jannaschia aquimarina TaxID=935700 RepID=A0A0D1CHP4_9RHOB|nr:TerB family tellurite resistance protein [Jannaschia aquimarina]KIT14217.1 Tellurite resistance protein TerB [Jannaschia aquimarina]SNS48406.1 Tellurite resistance protein TerB [Jannaschia aquimarina]
MGQVLTLAAATMAAAILSLATPAEAGRSDGFDLRAVGQMAKGAKTWLQSGLYPLDPAVTVDLGRGRETLCHRRQPYAVWHMLGLVEMQVEYALSREGCRDRGGEPLPMSVDTLQSIGRLPATLPAAPAFVPTERDKLIALGPWVAFGAILTLVSLRRGMRSRRRRIRREIMGLPDGPVFRLIDAMAHAAACDGDAAPEELEHILRVAREVTDLDYTADHISELVSRSERPRSVGAMRREFADGLTVAQGRLMLNAVLSVVAADGRMAGAEKRFVNRLTKALGFRRKEVRTALADMLSRRGDAAPA